MLRIVVFVLISSAVLCSATLHGEELPVLQHPVAPTHANVKYGDHKRHVMDVWLVDSPAPAPVLVSIHGGGFYNGDRQVDEGLLKACLKAKIAVVAITYRITDEVIAPAQFDDSARAIQFVRHNAAKWNIDPQRIAATGGSAGAGLSLWLGFHDDLADPESDDPIARQSTRLTCMTVVNGQSSYDPRFIRDLLPGTDIYRHPALVKMFDVDMDELDSLPVEKYRLFEHVSSLTHLTKDDVPVQLIYNMPHDQPITSDSIGIHHPKFGKVLQEKMQQLEIECELLTNIRGGARGRTKYHFEFLKKHLLANKPDAS